MIECLRVTNCPDSALADVVSLFSGFVKNETL